MSQTFFRAVYSRAKHIIIDDTLSAVDAHTAEHLMLNCITGPLMVGRTRILVTHHVGLSLTKADYVVSLKDGNVEVSGTAKELKDSGALAAILEEANNGIEFEDIIETAAEDIQSINSSDIYNIKLTDSTLGESSTATNDE